MRATRMTPKEALCTLNASAHSGRLNVLDFLERHFILEGTQQKPINFEPWQKDHILKPVIGKVDGKRPWDAFLIGIAKKNGKSTLAACIATYALLLDDPNPEVYSAAGDKDQAKIIFDFTKKAFERSPALRPLVKIYKDVIQRVDGNGFYRALARDSSGSHGLNPSCVIFDELWNQPDYGLWEALTLSPARQNPFHFIVTYAGFQARSGNLLWDLYSRGLSGNDPKMYMFWRNGANANPASWVTPEYLERQRRWLPDHIFRRDHLNEWSTNEATRVFRIAQECWQGEFQDYVPGARYVAGIDLAKSRDFTAWAIIRTDVKPFRVVDLGKLPHIDYTRQVEMLAATLKRFGNPKALVDAGAAGAAVIELMRKQGLAVKEFIFNNSSKGQTVTDLVVGFEQRKLLMPSSGRTLDESRAVQDLEGELHNFEPTVLRSGNLRYEAGSGYHDDLVMALCLAYSGASHVPREPMVEVIDLGPFVRGGDTREGNFTWHRRG
jgi:Phage Terminase